MAAAEARAAWQRTANRCFVQEDAKRAPKLACCQSSSSSSRVQSEPSCGDAADVPNHPATFLPFNWNPTYSNLPPDTKWWLQLQPGFAHQKEFTNEQPSSLSELEDSRNVDTMPTSKHKEDPLSTEDNYIEPDKSTGSLLEPQQCVSVNCMKHDSEARVRELKAGNSNNKLLLQQKAYLSEWVRNQKDYSEDELMDWESIDLYISNQQMKTCLDIESSWIWSDRTEPWWRTADRDELASLVAQKSLYQIENCDLPRPQALHAQKGQFTCLASFNHNSILASSLDHKLHSGRCTPIEYAQCSPASVSMAGEHCPLTEIHRSCFDSEKSFGGTHSSTIMDPTDSRHTSGSEQSKAQLLEALRHSQTRAREAEKAAQQAYNEKEHIIKLFFKQASYLFAYKQWLRVLQLESLLLQLKAKDHQLSMLFPVLPWMPLKARQMRKAVHKMKRTMIKKTNDIGKCAVAFAVGLSLVGAGLLLGWTLGWLLSSL